jgi:hypothetical protein
MPGDLRAAIKYDQCRGAELDLVALTFIGSRTEFRRALAASTIHDFYNLLALLIFFPVELIWHLWNESAGP